MANFYINSKGERVYGYNSSVNEKKNPTVSADDLNATLKKVVGNSLQGQATSNANALRNEYSAMLSRQNELLQQQYNEAMRQRKANLDATVNANNSQADEALRSAYVANMLAKKNLPQQLKANGISGGATETTLADIYNTYMNNRNAIDRQRINANNQAQLAYDTGAGNDYSNYLAKLSNLENSRYNATANAYKSSGVSDSKVNSTVKNMTDSQKVATMTAYYRNLGYDDDQIAYIMRSTGLVK